MNHNCSTTYQCKHIFVLAAIVLWCCCGSWKCYAAESYVIDNDTIDLNLPPTTHDIASTTPTDTICPSEHVNSTLWIKQLFKNGFKIHDPAVKYPAFPKFALKVYDWGNNAFNSYDQSYVVGTGKNWKANLKNYNWMESYMVMFAPKSKDVIHVQSDMYVDIGAYLSFMALSGGYTKKVNNWLWAGNGSGKREHFNFNFTCSRIFANLDYTNTKGNARITHFAAYKSDLLPMPFRDIKHKSLVCEAFYIFNYYKYSQAAAYCYSKYQLKSAGSWLAGFLYNHQNMYMNFESLPPEMIAHLPYDDNLIFKFKYSTYGICGGYAYNYVIRPKSWLFNVTTYPSVGLRKSEGEMGDIRRYMVSVSLNGKIGLVYNHRALFVALAAQANSYLYFNSKYTFFNTTNIASLNVGARF